MLLGVGRKFHHLVRLTGFYLLVVIQDTRYSFKLIALSLETKLPVRHRIKGFSEIKEYMYSPHFMAILHATEPVMNSRKQGMSGGFP